MRESGKRLPCSVGAKAGARNLPSRCGGDCARSGARMLRGRAAFRRKFGGKAPPQARVRCRPRHQPRAVSGSGGKIGQFPWKKSKVGRLAIATPVPSMVDGVWGWSDGPLGDHAVLTIRSPALGSAICFVAPEDRKVSNDAGGRRSDARRVENAPRRGRAPARRGWFLPAAGGRNGRWWEAMQGAVQVRRRLTSFARSEANLGPCAPMNGLMA